MIIDFKTAVEILELELYCNESDGKCISLKYLKKKYHKMALQNHPDKNGNSVESNEKFRSIQEAYEFLQREITEEKDSGLDSGLDLDPDDWFDTSYLNILKPFINEMMKGEYNDLINDIIADIVSGCKKISLKLFEKLDKEAALDVFTFLSKFKSILHINQETIDSVKEIILEKYKSDQVYILNPSIDDLFENNIYRLDIDGEKYLVPLWHTELYFDKKELKDADSGGEIIVKCIPDLPENIDIDENNNLLVSVKIPFTFSLFEQKSIPLFIGKKEFHVEISKLKMERVQYIFFYEMGISQINEHDMYKVEPRANITFKIIFQPIL